MNHAPRVLFITSFIFMVVGLTALGATLFQAKGFLTEIRIERKQMENLESSARNLVIQFQEAAKEVEANRQLTEEAISREANIVLESITLKAPSSDESMVIAYDEVHGLQQVFYDKNSKPRLIIGSRSGDRTGISFLDQEGHRRLSMGSYEGKDAFGLAVSAASEATTLLVGEDGSGGSGFASYTNSGKIATYMGTGDDSSHLQIYDRAGDLRFNLRTNSSTIPFYWSILDGQGQPRIVSGVDGGETAFLEMFRRSGGNELAFSIKSTDVGGFSNYMVKSAGQELWDTASSVSTILTYIQTFGRR